MIKNYNIEKIKELSNKKNYKSDKELFGKIFPNEIFKNPNLKWLDPGAGSGNFSIYLYYKLLENLNEEIPDINIRSDHIISNMIYIVEYRDENVKILEQIFGENANIYNKDYIDYSPSHNFDVIIGNPPFNFNGQKKVPTNSKNNKKQDGQTIWIDFVKHSISLLKNDGFLNMFIPSIWLKPDREKMYYFLLKYDIQYLNCFSNTETNKIFKGNAQTPSCYFLLTKKPNTNKISIFDNNNNKYIDFALKPNIPIPLCNIEIVNIFQEQLKKYKHIDVIKTNLPPKGISLSPSKLGNHIYPNIRTRLLKNEELIIEYSNKPLFGYGKSKLVLANKMYGLPYLDLSGEYGISNRDNYVIYKENNQDLIKLSEFLSTELVQKVYESTRYRMKYLEKYAFELLPDITSLNI